MTERERETPDPGLDRPSVLARPIPLYRRFTVRLVAWMLFVAALPATAVGIVTYSLARSALERELRGRLLGVAEHKAERLETWAETRRAAMSGLARSPRLVTALAAKLAEGAKATALDPSLVVELSAQLGELGVDSVLVFSAAGTVVGSTGETALLGRSVDEPDVAKSAVAFVVERARTVAETEFTDFSQDSLVSGGDGTPRAILAAPVLASGRVVGVLVGEVDNAELWHVTADVAGLGETGQIEVVGHVGDGATALAPTRRDPNAAFHEKVPLDGTMPATLALLGARGSGVSKDARGVPVFAVWRYLPSLRWGIVTAIDEAEAFAPARRLQWVSMGITLGAALIAGLAAFVIARRVSRPVGALTRQAMEIANGDLDRRVDVTGEDELAELSRVFNFMVAELQRHTAGLEDQVAKRTRELSHANDELVEKARRIRESVDLARQIESSMLPDVEQKTALLEDVGLIWRPLDEVSGDLVFLERIESGGFIAGVLDCSGHGVPAAMTAMFASATCSLAIATHGSQGPAAVIKELDRRLLGAFERARSVGLSVGLDVALVVAQRGRPLRFVGAGIDLLYETPAGELIEMRGQRRGLGYGVKRRGVPFEEMEIDVEGVSTLYLMSDGVLDEPVGERGEGLGRTRLKALVKDLPREPLADRVGRLDKALIALRGERSQRDDVTLLALELTRSHDKKDGA